jgi:hypothetical protein
LPNIGEGGHEPIQTVVRQRAIVALAAHLRAIRDRGDIADGAVRIAVAKGPLNPKSVLASLSYGVRYFNSAISHFIAEEYFRAVAIDVFKEDLYRVVPVASRIRQGNVGNYRKGNCFLLKSGPKPGPRPQQTPQERGRESEKRVLADRAPAVRMATHFSASFHFIFYFL